MRGAVRGSVKGCCRARRRALRARRSLFSLINFLPRTLPRPAKIFFNLFIRNKNGFLSTPQLQTRCQLKRRTAFFGKAVPKKQRCSFVGAFF